MQNNIEKSVKIDEVVRIGGFLIINSDKMFDALNPIKQRKAWRELEDKRKDYISKKWLL